MMTQVFDFYEIKPGHFISFLVILAWAWLDLVNWKLTKSFLPFIIILQGVKQYRIEAHKGESFLGHNFRCDNDQNDDSYLYYPNLQLYWVNH